MSTPGVVGPDGDLGRVFQRRLLPAVVVVLRQVPVGEHAGPVDLLDERVVATRAVVHPHDRETHRLVPRRARRVVGRADLQHVTGLHRDRPVVARRGHRHVPRHRARGLVVLGRGLEEVRVLAVAQQIEVDVQTAGVEVTEGVHEHARLLDRPLVLRGAAGVRIGGLVGVGERATASRTLQARRTPGRRCRSARPSRSGARPSCRPAARRSWARCRRRR